MMLYAILFYQLSLQKRRSKMTRGVISFVFFFFFLLTLSTAHGEIINEDSKLLSSESTPDDNFGISVSVSGDVMAVGAFEDTELGYDSGSAYIFRYNGVTWVEEQKLLASDGDAGDHFGYSVSVSDDVAVVGAYDKDSGTGSAYIFRYDGLTWVEEQKLLASDGAIYDYFGYSVSVSGDVAFIGAYCNNGVDYASGAAYVFKYNGLTWDQEQKLLASDGDEGDQFGVSVSVSGDVAVIGAFNDEVLGQSSGSAYIFRHNGLTWIQEQKLLASDGEDWNYFGISVSVSCDVAVIGAYHDAALGTNSGSAYIFRYNGVIWIEEQKLLASDGEVWDEFGYSVSVSGDIAVIGAYSDDDMGGNSGSAYIFRYNGLTWDEESKLLASDGEEWDRFGQCVSVSGDVAVIGAPYDDDMGNASGSVYVFDLSGGFVDLTLTRTGPMTVYSGGTLFFSTQIKNNTGNPVAGDFWLSVLLPNMNELVIPGSILNYSNPLSGQIPPNDTLSLDNELYVPTGAPAGWYMLIGRVGVYPNTVLDVSTFPFQVE
jgi:hypothetical protein